MCRICDVCLFITVESTRFWNEIFFPIFFKLENLFSFPVCSPNDIFFLAKRWEFVSFSAQFYIEFSAVDFPAMDGIRARGSGWISQLIWISMSGGGFHINTMYCTYRDKDMDFVIFMEVFVIWKACYFYYIHVNIVFVRITAFMDLFWKYSQLIFLIDACCCSSIWIFRWKI